MPSTSRARRATARRVQHAEHLVVGLPGLGQVQLPRPEQLRTTPASDCLWPWRFWIGRLRWLSRRDMPRPRNITTAIEELGEALEEG
jgi:hypothetical protein